MASVTRAPAMGTVMPRFQCTSRLSLVIMSDVRARPDERRAQLAAPSVGDPHRRNDVGVDYQGLAEVPYGYAAVAPGGATLFTAGACPLDEGGRVVAPGDHRAQAERAVDNLLGVLGSPPRWARGATKDDRVRRGGSGRPGRRLGCRVGPPQTTSAPQHLARCYRARVPGPTR